MCKITSILFNMLLFFILTDISHGFYIKKKDEVKKPNEMSIDRNTLDQSWNMFNRGKQHNNAKAKSLRNEKPQTTAMEKFLNMISHNKKTKVAKIVEKQQAKKDVHNLFNTLLTLAKEELKQSTLKTLNRPRRRISLQLFSDIPSEKIDELLKVFIDENKINNAEEESESQKHDDNNDDSDNDSDSDDDVDDDDNYADFDMLAPTKKYHDYAYDNLHENGNYRGSNSNSEYGSIQDLILQATKSQWQRDNEENYNTNEHFI